MRISLPINPSGSNRATGHPVSIGSNRATDVPTRKVLL